MGSSQFQRIVGIGIGITVILCSLNIILIGAINRFSPETIDTIAAVFQGDVSPAEATGIETILQDQIATVTAIPTAEATPTPENELTEEAIATEVVESATAEAINETEAEPDEAAVVTPTYTPTPLPAVSCGPLDQQIEMGELVGNMEFLTNDKGEIVLSAPQTLGRQLGSASKDDRVDLCFGIQRAGWYRIGGEIQADTQDSNSFAISINNNFDAIYPWHVFPFGIQRVTYLTDRDGDNPVNEGNPLAFYFEAGDHVVSIHNREPGTQIDTLHLAPVYLGSQNEFETRQPQNHYVSRNGSNLDGKTWETAWSELSDVDWTIIGPGDTLYIDGGETDMQYTTPLIVGSSGTAAKPITIRVSEEDGRNGQVVIFGGRAELLPECGASSFVFTPPNYEAGIDTNHHDWLIFEGNRWYGIAIHGFHATGVMIRQYSNDIVFRNGQITNNGFALEDENGYYTDGPGVRLGGKNLTFERMVIHDNGQDAFQASWDYFTEKNLVVRQSWLYNGRNHSEYRASWNWCTHTDSLQIYEGEVVSDILFEEVFIGPGFTNSLIMGDKQGGTYIENLTMRDVVISKPDDNGLNLYIGPSQNVLLEHVTFDCQNTYFNCLRMRGTGHQIVNSLFIGGNSAVTDGTIIRDEGNCHQDLTGLTVGEESSLKFQRNVPDQFMTKDNYTLAPDSACIGKGSRITSIDDLFALP